MNINAGLERLFAGRWIAGYYPEDAIKRIKLFNSVGISALVNLLGEEVVDRGKVGEAVSTYIDMIDYIKANSLDAGISVKPTQIGLSVGYRTMLANYLKIARAAKKKGILVWLDMENPGLVDSTIKAYLAALKYGNTGICIQAYLRRSEIDINMLSKRGAKIRLVKGAYQIRTDEVFHSHREISQNYGKLMKILFAKANDFMLATHDSRIIEEAINLNKKYRKRVTYAMLNGIRNKYALHLQKNGQRVAVYIPFGKDWVDFGYRRMAEQRHMTMIIRSLLQRQDIWQN